MANKLGFELHKQAVYAATVTLKITYANMRQITRSKSGEPTNRADEIYSVAKSLLDTIEKRPIRLVGISLSNLNSERVRQLSLLDDGGNEQKEKLDATVFRLRQKYGKDAVKTGNELMAEKRFQDGGEGKA
jgi:DNA polymerase-4/DNA polymerase IV (DinB-like DNA polymerase)